MDPRMAFVGSFGRDVEKTRRISDEKADARIREALVCWRCILALQVLNRNCLVGLGIH